MLKKDIEEGKTYLFLATDSPARKHLEGQPFTVVEIKKVWRKIVKRGSRQTWRFFNDDGIGARADELEPMDEDNVDYEKLATVLESTGAAAVLENGEILPCRVVSVGSNQPRSDATAHTMVINWSKRGGKTKAVKDRDKLF
jgi:hypothetical protein